MIGRTNAGGGSSLNLRIKIHEAAPRPGQTGKENEIWVVSDVPSRYWAVKNTEPTAADFGEAKIPNGAIWIVDDGKSNGFDALKDGKKFLSVCPSMCKLYDGGTWKFTDAYIHTGGNWVKFSSARLYIVKDGYLQNGISVTGTNTVRQGYSHSGKSVLYMEEGNGQNVNLKLSGITLLGNTLFISIPVIGNYYRQSVVTVLNKSGSTIASYTIPDGSNANRQLNVVVKFDISAFSVTGASVNITGDGAGALGNYSAITIDNMYIE